FWMLGTNIGQVGWPQSGEVDIMEYVSRIPDNIFGTIHGPGYSGGAGFGNAYQFPGPVASDYHTFAVEWGPDEIHWYVDGINFHNATPADVAPNEWVFNHPFYLILNMAIGGNFGGDIDPTMTFPQELKVDYVRVYGAADTAERFEASFADDTAGWRKVEIPFVFFRRSAVQPEGAPDDGLTLTAVNGYGFGLPANSSGSLMLDQLRVEPTVTVPAWVGRIHQTTEADPLVYGSIITVDVRATNYSGTTAQPFLVVPLDGEVGYVPGSATDGAFPLTAGQMAALGYAVAAQANAGDVVAVAYNNPVANGQDATFSFQVRVQAAQGAVQHTLLTPAGATSSNRLDITPTVIVELPLLADTWVSSGLPNQNYNAFAALIARTSGVDNVLLTFDRSTLPVGARLVSATLRLNATFQSGADGKELRVMNVTPFDAATVTFADGLTFYNPGPAIPVALGPLDLDATAQVAGWDAAVGRFAAQDGLGYLAVSASGPAGRVAFDSLETYRAQPPTLTVVYMP
ncbi:MAG: glycosyl hydrolase family protein, partial [Caldilineae bacterium]